MLYTIGSSDRVTTATLVNAEARRLFGRESPELLDRLHPVLDRFGTDLDAKVTAATSDLRPRRPSNST